MRSLRGLSGPQGFWEAPDPGLPEPAAVGIGGQEAERSRKSDRIVENLKKSNNIKKNYLIFKYWRGYLGVKGLRKRKLRGFCSD